jgi:lipopolysaccharide/colanic/teichoic acid biosynthesis glycosyltransferase
LQKAARPRQGRIGAPSKRTMKRLFDIVSSLVVLLVLFPFFLLIALLIALDSRGSVFYKQIRVGKGNRDFGLYKFRTMVSHADKQGQLTVGMRDNRITRIGYFLRKYKLDEFPQLINILKGDMSVVGPRPEVRKYVDLYSEEQLKALTVRPGLTDYASMEYANENEILGASENPEKTYVEQIMPAKLSLNLKYVREQSLRTDLMIIFRTIGKIFG